MSRSLIRKTQLHPDIADLVGQYGSGYFIDKSVGFLDGASISQTGLSITLSGNWQTEPIFLIDPVAYPTLGSNSPQINSGKWIEEFWYNESSASGGPLVSGLVFHDLYGIKRGFYPRNMSRITYLGADVLTYVGGNEQLGFSPSSMPLLTGMNFPQLQTIGGYFNPSLMNNLIEMNFPELKRIGSSFTVTSNFSSLTGLSFPALEEIGGMLFINISNINSLNFPMLKKIGGYFSPSINNITTLNFPSLENIGAFFGLTSMFNLTGINFPVLKTIGGNFNSNYCNLLSGMNFPQLEVIGTNFAPSNLNSITGMNFPVLKTVLGAFSPSSMPVLSGMNFPQLQTIGGFFNTVYLANLTGMNFPQLETVGGAFNPSMMPVLTSMDFPVLRVVSGAFNPSIMSVLTDMNFPQLETVGGAFNPSSMGNLTNINFPQLETISGGNFSPDFMGSVTGMNLPVLKNINGRFSPSLTGLLNINLPSLEFLSSGFAPILIGRVTGIQIPSLRFLSGNFSIPSTASTSLSGITFPNSGTWRTFNGNVNIQSRINSNTVSGLFSNLAYMDGNNSTLFYGTGRSVIVSGTPTHISTRFASGTEFVCSGTTCRVTITGHGYNTNDVLRVTGVLTATNANRYALINVLNSDQFTYTITSQNATGSGVATVSLTNNDVKAIVTRGVTLTTL